MSPLSIDKETRLLGGTISAEAVLPDRGFRQESDHVILLRQRYHPRCRLHQALDFLEPVRIFCFSL
jgi:hypothetical protein